jgi:hypothetical protein
MAVRPEVLAQLARMLSDDAVRSASDDEVRAIARTRFSSLAEALLAETAASDDVTDAASALAYVDARLEALAAVLGIPLCNRLREELQRRIDAW